MSQINTQFAEDQNLDQPNVFGTGDMSHGAIGGEKLPESLSTGLNPSDLTGSS